MRECMRYMSATVSNLRARIDARACLATAITAILIFFAALGMMHIPSIIISGLTALTCALFAPMGDADSTIDKEGGAA